MTKKLSARKHKTVVKAKNKRARKPKPMRFPPKIDISTTEELAASMGWTGPPVAVTFSHIDDMADDPNIPLYEGAGAKLVVTAQSLETVAKGKRLFKMREETLDEHRREAFIKGMMFGAECARGMTQMNRMMWPGCKRFIWQIAGRVGKGEDIEAIQRECATQFARMDEESAATVALINRQKTEYQAAMKDFNLGWLGRFWRMLGLK